MQKMVQTKRSKEFEEKKMILDLQSKVDKERHNMWMEGLKFQRETEELKHQHELERGRIKSAEIKKMQERKELMRLGNRHY